MMKRQELDQLRQRSKPELVAQAAEARSEVVRLRLARGQNPQPGLLQARRKLAQLETLIRQKDAL